ncbi:MAG: mechanosensitive ion channel domain-containing protein [Bacteroidota bacterium]
MWNTIWNRVLWENEAYTLRVAEVCIFAGTLILVILLELLIRRWVKRGKPFQKVMNVAGLANMQLAIIRVLLYGLGIYLAFRFIGVNLLTQDLITLREENGVKKTIKAVDVIMALLVVLIARIILNYSKYQLTQGKDEEEGLSKKDLGRRLAIYQLIRYVIYVVAIILILANLQINLSFFIASSAALFVGVGLALQSTFSDVASGIIILIERTIEVGDMVFIDSLGLEGKVVETRLRTTIIETLDGVAVIVPNAKFTNTNVVNWSFSNEDTRFRLDVGVAYGSDVNLVRKVLKESALAHNRVLKSPPPRIRFKDFGNSSLDFEILFWTRNPMYYEDIMSDLRFKIESEFRKYQIEIPFPQRDLHLRSGFFKQEENKGNDQKDE